MRILFLLLSSLLFQSSVVNTSYAFIARSINPHWSSRLNSIAVPSSQLEETLTSAERSITSVVRRCGPSVAFVTSVLPIATRQSTAVSNRPPQGRGLGSGSGFIIDANGYIVTNFHVIERAYQIIQQEQQSTQWLKESVDTVTQQCSVLGSVVNSTLQQIPITVPLPQVFVRINSASQYKRCRIVSVQPELDVAVLKIINTTTTDRLSTVEFGSSGSLLVGQSLVAIGNPFGLDQTVTTGVVSALDREIATSTSGKIRNCIQTDASINPGNSGGPLLNLNSQVVGINTAIVTTSGSSAGIGFAVPSDKIEPVVRDMIRKDKAEQGLRPKMGFLGVTIIKGKSGNWINSVAPGSPAEMAGLRGIQTSVETGLLSFGDSIVAIGGKAVESYVELEQELQSRVRDEEVAITLQNAKGERRISYIKLGSK